jgi:hypothetical protein
MTYGKAGGIYKALAIIHSVWLVVGSSIKDIRNFFSLVTALTTDMGTEIGLIECPDVVEAYIRRLEGATMAVALATVDPASRLFPRAVRIPGWNHIYGGIMKKCTEEHDWPKYTHYLQCLCRLFRNRTWVDHLKRLHGGDAACVSLWLPFSAGFAKWRYETLYVVMDQLLVRRQFCATKLSADDFQSTQEREIIATCCKAGKDPGLWRWMQAWRTHIIGPLEYGRRWGMSCPCCPPPVGKKKRDPCANSGRKLPWAAEKTQQIANAFAEAARTMGPDKCEGDQRLTDRVTTALRRTAGLHTAKT